LHASSARAARVDEPVVQRHMDLAPSIQQVTEDADCRRTSRRAPVRATCSPAAWRSIAWLTGDCATALGGTLASQRPAMRGALGARFARTTFI
jgi:hypothetical protein